MHAYVYSPPNLRYRPWVLGTEPFLQPPCICEPPRQARRLRKQWQAKHQERESCNYPECFPSRPSRLGIGSCRLFLVLLTICSFQERPKNISQGGRESFKTKQKFKKLSSATTPLYICFCRQEPTPIYCNIPLPCVVSLSRYIVIFPFPA